MIVDRAPGLLPGAATTLETGLRAMGLG
jgi:hypothetical protein